MITLVFTHYEFISLILLAIGLYLTYKATKK